MASSRAILRISKEIQDINTGSDLSIAVTAAESDVQHVRALIIGPPGTPYEYGFFEFALHFGSNYPTSPPKVNALTTNGGQTRYNPNIYANGKVCLSILGTWRGESGENWSSAQGLESVLLSIQSLMSSNPYENEPGFENARAPEDLKRSEAYVAKIKHETIRISVIQRLEDHFGLSHGGFVPLPPAPWDQSDEELDIATSVNNNERPRHRNNAKDKVTVDAFLDLCKQRFLWYFETYLSTVNVELKKFEDDSNFTSMPFESQGNTMSGQFQYNSLKKRLLAIKEKLDEERIGWTEIGLQAHKNGEGKAVNLKQQFAQICEYNKNKVFNLEIETADGNPFLWNMTLYGRPMSKLEGGIIKIAVYISPQFPEVQPRVVVITPLFHQRIAQDGTLCYFVKKVDDMKSHVEAIVEALEHESVPYDPRSIVRPEATRLFWGTVEERKHYNRLLRRSVEASSEL